MHICFISYEYPPDTGIGGIATYVQQIARLFASKEIEVTVICASPHESKTIQENKFLTIIRIKCRDTKEFRSLSPAVAAGYNLSHPIDLIEVPEYGAEGLFIKDHLPDATLVVKLHTPKFLIKELNDYYYDQTFLREFKNKIGLGYNISKDPEYKAIQLADYILSPSLSLANIVAEKWGIPKEKILHAPNPYFPSPGLLGIPLATSSKKILYMGRLETRKGMYNLAKAIPLVIKKIPDAQFILLGKDSQGPMRERSMKAVMLKQIGPASDQVTFVDHVPPAEIPLFLSQVSTCIFPSLWENFPNVCLEAMSAGRSIIASREGGMTDMLEDIDAGIFVDPYDVESIVAGIEESMVEKNSNLPSRLRAREKADDYYGHGLVDELLSLYHSFLK
jgi:glycogen synthase